MHCRYSKPAKAVVDPSELIKGGSFEEPTAIVSLTGRATDPSSMPPYWTVTGGDVDWGAFIVPDMGYPAGNSAAEGKQFIDLCGTTLSGTIEQTVPTVAGTKYTLKVSAPQLARAGGSLHPCPHRMPHLWQLL